MLTATLLSEMEVQLPLIKAMTWNVLLHPLFVIEPNLMGEFYFCITAVLQLDIVIFPTTGLKGLVESLHQAQPAL